VSEVSLSIRYCLCLILSVLAQKVNKQDSAVEVADRSLLKRKNKKKKREAK
jgi:hypothetical protein